MFTSVLLYNAIKLFINLCSQALSYYSGCQPLHCTCSLVYWCTIHAKSVMNHACLMFCPCPSPIFKIYVSEILYERVFILNYVIWNENEWEWQAFCLLLIYLKHSTEQNNHFIKQWNLKWKGVDRDRLLKLLSLNWIADTADKIMSGEW